jgi:hypothetical protein
MTATYMCLLETNRWGSAWLSRLPSSLGKPQLTGVDLQVLTLESALVLALGLPRCMDSFTSMAVKFKGLRAILRNAERIGSQAGQPMTPESLAAISRHSELMARVVEGNSWRGTGRQCQGPKVAPRPRCSTKGREVLPVTRCSLPSCSGQPVRQGRCRAGGDRGPSTRAVRR